MLCSNALPEVDFSQLLGKVKASVYPEEGSGRAAKVWGRLRMKLKKVIQEFSFHFRSSKGMARESASFLEDLNYYIEL